MIINVRGANGSGKSTVVRRVLESFQRETKFVPGRARPIGYQCVNGPYVVGTYENVTGGCDTIPSIEMIFEIVKLQADAGRDVLYEGILAQHSATRLMELNRVHPVTVVVLTTSQEDCVQAVRDRRAARGEEKPLDPTNVVKEYQSVISSTRRLKSAGVEIIHLDREAAFEFCLRSLKGSAKCAE